MRPLKTRTADDAGGAKGRDGYGERGLDAESFANVRTSGPSGPTNPRGRKAAGAESRG